MTLDKTTQKPTENLAPPQPPSDSMQDTLRSGLLPSVPPHTDENQRSTLPEFVAPTSIIGSDPEQILTRIIAGERELITSVREGLNVGDLLCKDVWRNVCKQCNTIPRDVLLHFVSEAYHVEKRRPAHNLAITILCEPQFSNDEELVASAVKLLRDRELLSVRGTDARLRERGEAYGEHVPKEICDKLATLTTSNGMLFVIDHAAAACIQLRYERFIPNPAEQRSVLFAVDAQMHALDFAQKFPYCENPWFGVVAKLNPGRILDWYYNNLQARSIAPVASDYRSAAFKAALAPLLLYGANSLLGAELLGAAATLATYLKVSAAFAGGSLVASGLSRRKSADRKFHPLQREQLYKVAEEILAQRGHSVG